MSVTTPKVVIAGMGGDSGKTLVSCGLLVALKRMGKGPVPFKKGPDYIDSAWLTLAAGKQCRNLDTFMIDRETNKEIFFNNIMEDEIAVIEGNRGLFDGADVNGTHSTAELAKLLGVPVILVLDGTKVTRSLAAVVLGCKEMDSSLNVGGVILNNVSGKRHAKVTAEAIEQVTGVPVIGVIKRYKDYDLLPSRHLGLVTPAENEKAKRAVEFAGDIITESIDFQKFFEIASATDDIPYRKIEKVKGNAAIVRIGYFNDRAFSFYYPENLEALQQAGAELVKLSAIEDRDLKNIDGLYIGGGFPETNLKALSKNREMMKVIKDAVENGMPVYAECGGLMYLSKKIIWGGESFDMCGVLPFAVTMNEKPQGHGYVEAEVDTRNQFFDKGQIVKGHEFHYSSIYEKYNDIQTVLNVKRGKGAENNRDGFIIKNVFASYMHIHAFGTKNWAVNFLKAVIKYVK